MAIYAADKLTNVTMLRDAYGQDGEQGIERELKVPLDEKVEIWEQDLEMLRDNAGESPAIRALAAGLSDQLRGLTEDRAASRAAPG